MFTGITWSNYIVAVIFLLAAYYAYIWLRFYSGSLQSFLTDRLKFNPEDNEFMSGVENDLPTETSGPVQPEVAQTQHSFVQTPEDAFGDVELLINELKGAIAEASGKKYIKQEFSLVLQRILRKYPGLKGSMFGPPINELITSECTKYSFVEFSEDELALLWNG